MIDITILNKLWFWLVAKLLGKKPGRIKKKWVFDTKSSIMHPAIIADIDEDDRPEIIFGARNGNLYVLSDAGKLKWKASLRQELGKVRSMFVETETANSILGAPVLGECDGKKIIIAATTAGIIESFHPDGKPFWRFKIKGSVFNTPLYADINGDKNGEVIFGSDNKKLYALSSKGKMLWKYQAKSAITSPAAFYGDDTNLLLFGTEHGFIKAVSKNGKFKWKYQTGGKVSAKPAIADIFNDGNKRIIVGSSDKSMYVLDKFGELEWQYRTHGEILSEAILADIDNDKDSEIFFGACDDVLYALAPNSQKIWSYETDFWIVAPPIVVDVDSDGAFEIVVGSYDKSLYVLEGRGTFSLNYIPGLSIIANQPGHFTPFITSQPGELIGKRLWRLRTGGVITGVSLLAKEKKELIISTKEGKLLSAYYEI